MKIAIVVQRYGADVSGGAELHARYIAEHLARHLDVEVLTTCATDYVTWRNDLRPGREIVTGLTVHRFEVAKERNVGEFGARSRQVFDELHSLADELAWIDSEGPTSPALMRFIADREADFDYFLFFSYRYYHAYHGVRTAARKAVLVPTAERDAAIGLSVFKPVFRGVRALMYNSPEERRLIEDLSDNRHVPGVVVGVGSEVPQSVDPQGFRQKYEVREPYVIYVGRIDENKGCRELFTFFQHYLRTTGSRLTLILIGTAMLPIPEHARIRHLGYLSDQDKFDGIAGSDLLIMPSRYESLSMVALEAWGLGRPVLANGTCDVLRGQCVRSEAGLYYDSYPEFAETLHAMTTTRALNAALGRQGRRFFQEHYAWPVIERKYLDMLAMLDREGPDSRRRAAGLALPGWIARHRRTLPPSREVVDLLPTGPVVADDRSPAAALR